MYVPERAPLAPVVATKAATAAGKFVRLATPMTPAASLKYSINTQILVTITLLPGTRASNYNTVISGVVNNHSFSDDGVGSSEGQYIDVLGLGNSSSSTDVPVTLESC